MTFHRDSQRFNMLYGLLLLYTSVNEHDGYWGYAFARRIELYLLVNVGIIYILYQRFTVIFDYHGRGKSRHYSAFII